MVPALPRVILLVFVASLETDSLSLSGNSKTFFASFPHTFSSFSALLSAKYTTYSYCKDTSDTRVNINIIHACTSNNFITTSIKKAPHDFFSLPNNQTPLVSNLNVYSIIVALDCIPGNVSSKSFGGGVGGGEGCPRISPTLFGVNEPLAHSFLPPPVPKQDRTL